MQIKDRQNIEKFFKEKTYNPGENSSLALLRNDIDRCFSSEILYPGVTGIMIGIDLLAKFYKGDDSNSGVGDRFKNFLKVYFFLCNKEEEYIYQLRNAMIHSFGLFSMDSSGIIYRFNLKTEGDFISSCCRKAKEMDIIINICELKERFNQAVYFYKKDLLKEDEVFKNFKKIKIERYLQIIK